MPRLCSGLTGEQKCFQGKLQLFPHPSPLLNDAIVSGMLEKLHSQDDNMELGTTGQGPSELARLWLPPSGAVAVQRVHTAWLSTLNSFSCAEASLLSILTMLG